MTPADISKLIRKRRSIFPKTYIDKPIPKEIIEEVLENANWAPNHKLTEPWRFKVLRGKALERLRDWQLNWYITNVPKEKQTEKKLKKLRNNPLKAGAMIAIHNIGAYWSSPRFIKHIGDFLGLQEGERCLGFFYMGYHTMPEIAGKRKPISDKVEWLE